MRKEYDFSGGVRGKFYAEYTLIGRDGVGNLVRAGKDTIRFMVVFDARRRGNQWIRLRHPWRANSPQHAARKVENEWLKKSNSSTRVRLWGTV